MDTINNLDKIQSELSNSDIDAWVCPDYRGSNEIFKTLAGGNYVLTRRAILVIPKTEVPKALIHIIDKPQFAPSASKFKVEYYRTWQEYEKWISTNLGNHETIATEYSPNNAIPTMSQVDGGTLDLLRGCCKVVSSAGIYQQSVSAWTLDDYEGHKKSVDATVASLRGALDYIKESLLNDVEITELDVQHFLVKQFETRGLVTDHPPIVAISPNNGNPHYDPNSTHNSVIRKDNLVLIDLWAKFKEGDCVFADITWMSYFGSDIPQKVSDVFSVVAKARDGAIKFVQDNISKSIDIQGFQVDDIAREIIVEAGYGEYFVHRTGHSMGPGDFLHARGVNIDNFETHDERFITSSVGFSIEPGIYMPEFGIRSEVDVFVHPSLGAIVTTPLQDEIEFFEV